MKLDIIFYTIGIPLITLFWNSVIKVFLSNRSFKHSREIFILQKRFEKEFELNQRLWELLIDNMIITGQLRPTLDFRENGKSLDQIKTERINKWNDTYHELRPIYLKSKPYISKELDNQIEKFLEISYTECVSYKVKEVIDYKEGEENIKKLSNTLDQIKLEIGKVINPNRK